MQFLKTDTSKSYEWIVSANGLKKSRMDFYEIFRKCVKWDKEEVIIFWE